MPPSFSVLPQVTRISCKDLSRELSSIRLRKYYFRLQMEEDLPVSLNDRCITLLESVIAENRRLRETIEARDAEQQQLLQLVSAKLDSTANNTTRQTRKRKRRVAVSQQCRVSIFLIL